jgi:hypothetical protein
MPDGADTKTPYPHGENTQKRTQRRNPFSCWERPKKQELEKTRRNSLPMRNENAKKSGDEAYLCATRIRLQSTFFTKKEISDFFFEKTADCPRIIQTSGFSYLAHSRISLRQDTGRGRKRERNKGTPLNFSNHTS